MTKKNSRSAIEEKGATETERIEIYGAREHNLKNIDVFIPRNQLVVVTGMSGSGKSSLAFDTIYAEGQRRYMETFSAYARQFIGDIERPDVDKITGLSPVISIEQKTTNKNPRSTVGTITEIYDFLRLLYARVGEAYSYITNQKMVRYTDEQIINLISEAYDGKTIYLLAPVVRARKGHYRELFEQIRKQGFLKVRVDGKINDITPAMQLDRYKTHNVEILIDTVKVSEKSLSRIQSSVQTAMKFGKGVLMVMETVSDKVYYYSKLLMDPVSGISYDEPEPNTFSFNSPAGYCEKCKGLGYVSEIDLHKIIPDKSKSIKKGGIAPVGEYKNNWIFRQLEAIAAKYRFTLDTPIKDIPHEAIETILYGSEEVIKVKNDYLGITNTYNLNFEGIVQYIVNQNEEADTEGIKRWAESFMNTVKCPECGGARLKKEALFYKIDDKNIADLASMDILSLAEWFKNVENKLNEKQSLIAFEIIREIKKRISFLLNVGLDYLSLNRSSATLSGGESQRIRLATQIGSQLVGVLYILDEPSIGLHQRDNHKLIESLKQLRDTGNSIIVVEHDEDMMLAADHLIDIGPGAGVHGGHIVSQGTPQEVKKSSSITGLYLSGKKAIAIPENRRQSNGKSIELKGASGNNLKNVDFVLPLGMFVCITGVSGSGKSTLINETLYPLISHELYRSVKKPLAYKSIEGLKNIDKVIEIDQSPIGRTPRSNPATYTGVFDDIRKLFAELPESKIRGYKPGRFSFNVRGGRCETCQGAGVRVIEMNFLPNVHVPCETCQGKRYNRETLEVRYKGKSISDVLDMTIEQAIEFFENIPSILQKINTLYQVGLGYITLGQQSTTLSGGEAQRVKLATELSKRDTGRTLYILDEPTTGLHFEDVHVLINVLNRLVDRGNTVLVIEHNMEVIKMADYIIDLGPEGGQKGGDIIVQGTPEEVVKNKKSYTAQYLKEVLKK